VNATPSPHHYRNDVSAVKEADFVGQAILELLRDNRIEELFCPPDIINPLSVSQFMTRYLHHIINSYCSWNSVVFVRDQLRKRGV